LSDGTTFPGYDPGIRIKFSKLAEPFVSALLPAINGRQEAWGHLDIDETAKKVGLKPKDVEMFLRSHPSNVANGGVEFAVIGESGQEISSEEQYVMREGESSYFCSLCDQHLPNKGAVTRHKASKKHVDALAEAEAAELDKLK
jgi:hypothetical protein